MIKTRICTYIVIVLALTRVLRLYPQGAQPPIEAPAAAVVRFVPPATESRHLVFISDLHFGVGRGKNGSWNPTEDFRWPRALRGFLNRIALDGHDSVDLVVVGDFREMWQRPPEIPCKGSGRIWDVRLMRWRRCLVSL
jgi:hypothetical protein